MSLPSTDALMSGYFFSACDGGLHEEAHEADLDAVLLLELLLEALAHFHHRRHVHFVEGGQDRVGRLRLHQAFGHARAQAAHRHALLGPRRPRDRRRWRGDLPGSAAFGAAAGAGAFGAGAGAVRLRAALFHRGEHVALGDAAILAGAGHRAGIGMRLSAMIFAAAGIAGACVGGRSHRARLSHARSCAQRARRTASGAALTSRGLVTSMPSVSMMAINSFGR